VVLISSYVLVLLLAGVELIFSIIACTVLWFGFVIKTVLVTQGCFSYCWAVLTEHQGLFCFSSHPTSEEAGGAPEIERRHSWDSWPPTDQRDIPYHTALCSAIKAGGRRRNGGMFRATAFVFPSNSYVCWSPAFLEMAAHSPDDGKQWMNPLSCFACARGFCFAY